MIQPEVWAALEAGELAPVAYVGTGEAPDAADLAAAPADARGAWLEWRRGGIGASDVAAIAGIEGAFGTPYSVWLSKVHGVDSEESEPMLWGSLIEDVVLNETERRIGLTIAARQLRLEHPEAPHHRATLDGAAFDRPPEALRHDHEPLNADFHGGFCSACEWFDLSNAVAGIEAKNTGFRSYPGGEPPLAYYCQAQWQMWCGNLSQVILTVLHAGTVLLQYPIERDDDDIAFLVEQADRFWTDHVLTGIPPELSHRDLDRVRKFVGPGDESTMYADDATLELVRQLAAAKASVKEATEYADRLQAILTAKLGAAELLLDQAGQPLATYKAARWFDVEDAVGMFPDDAARCRTLDLPAFKKALGKRSVEAYMRKSTDPLSPRTLTLKKGTAHQ